MKIVKKRFKISVFMSLIICALMIFGGCETKAFRANYQKCEWGMLDRMVKIIPATVFKNSGSYSIYGNFTTVSNHGEEVYSLEQDVTMDFSRLKIKGDVLLQTRYLEIVTEKDYELSTNKNNLVTKRYKDGKTEAFAFDRAVGVTYFMPDYFDTFLNNFKAAVDGRTLPIADVMQDYDDKNRYLKISVTPEVAAALFFETGVVSFASGEIFIVQDNTTGHILSMLLRFDAQGVAPDVVTSSNGIEKISTEFFVLKK